jgi:hypothetical protein
MNTCCMHIYRSHGKAGAVDEAGDVAIKVDEVEVMSSSLSWCVYVYVCVCVRVCVCIRVRLRTVCAMINVID